MAKALPPLAWFRAFEAAARRLSFTAAAQEIGLTQSAVSQHVKSLETSLGVPLFIRRARSLSLTDDGRKLLPQVSVALETLSAAARSFETGPSENLLTVATSVSVAQWVIAPRLAEFTNRHPNIRLRFLSTIWPDEFKTILADVEIPFMVQKQAGNGVLKLERSGLVAVKSSTLQGEFHTLPLIETVGISDGWTTFAQVVGRPATPKIFVDTYGAALTLALHGNGVALVSEFLARSALNDSRLILAHDAVIPSNEGYYLRVNNGNPAAETFRDWFLEGALS